MLFLDKVNVHGKLLEAQPDLRGGYEHQGLTASGSLPLRQAFSEHETHEVSNIGKDICFSDYDEIWPFFFNNPHPPPRLPPSACKGQQWLPNWPCSPASFPNMSQP